MEAFNSTQPLSSKSL